MAKPFYNGAKGKMGANDFVKMDEIAHLEERIAKLEGLIAKKNVKEIEVDG